MIGDVLSGVARVNQPRHLGAELLEQRLPMRLDVLDAQIGCTAGAPTAAFTLPPMLPTSNMPVASLLTVHETGCGWPRGSNGGTCSFMSLVE